MICDLTLSVCISYIFFFKQKTAYEMRISDWSSDVCSSDLSNARQIARGPMLGFLPFDCGADEPHTFGDRGEGKRHQLVAKAGIDRDHRLIGRLRFREILFSFRIGREYLAPRGR